jgi:hypothetical protein
MNVHVLAVIVPEDSAIAQPLAADEKRLGARATATCPTEHT